MCMCGRRITDSELNICPISRSSRTLFDHKPCAEALLEARVLGLVLIGPTLAARLTHRTVTGTASIYCINICELCIHFKSLVVVSNLAKWIWFVARKESALD